jgi:hypothetical protein
MLKLRRAGKAQTKTVTPDWPEGALPNAQSKTKPTLHLREAQLFRHQEIQLSPLKLSRK